MVYYRYYDVIKILCILAGVIALVEAILHFARASVSVYVDAGGSIVGPIVAIVLAIIALLIGLRPDDPFPVNWILLLILGILMIIFGSLIAGILLIIATVLCLVD